MYYRKKMHAIVSEITNGPVNLGKAHVEILPERKKTKMVNTNTAPKILNK